MKISLNWLKDYLPKVPAVAEFTEMLTFAGVEVEGVETTGADIAKVIVARILKSEKHPDADRLSVCEVDDGSGVPRQIVCGAKNYKVQDCVPLALPGAELHGGVKIKAGKLRGVKSDGMLCSGRELGIGQDADGLLILPADSTPGAPIGDVFPGDTVIEVEVTPNRPDLLSHCGIAREVGALARLDVKWPEIKHAGAVAKLAKTGVSINALKECPLYTARRITGVEVKPSPPWLAARLESIGLRPINNIVDVTNYVMLEMGQPLHAFDAAKLNGGIVVRLARPGEQLPALDGKIYGLAGDALVISDGSRPVALAGIMGGEDTGVKESTVEIMLESAYFEPGQIRRTSRLLGLSSDSSYRFERGIDPAGVIEASDRATRLILEIAGGEAGPVEMAAAPGIDALLKPWTVGLRYERCRALLGAEIADARIDELLTRLGLSKIGGEQARSEWSVPTFRRDLTREVDLIEEVMRIAGMTTVEPRMRGLFVGASRGDAEHDLRMKTSRRLVAAGFAEIRTMAMISEGALAADVFQRQQALRLRNPMSEDHALMRHSLIPGLLAAADKNLRYGANDLRLFEIGAVYGEDGAHFMKLGVLMTGQPGGNHWRSGAGRAYDVFDLKGVIEALCPVSFARGVEPVQPLDLDIRAGGMVVGRAAQLGVAAARALGARHPVLVAELALEPVFAQAERPLHYEPVVRFPAVTRDIALVGPRSVTHEEVLAVVIEAGGDWLESVELFDVFTDDTGAKLPADSRSLAYALTFRAPDRTLNDSEVGAAHEALLKAVTTKLPLKLRA